MLSVETTLRAVRIALSASVLGLPAIAQLVPAGPEIGVAEPWVADCPIPEAGIDGSFAVAWGGAAAEPEASVQVAVVEPDGAFGPTVDVGDATAFPPEAFRATSNGYIVMWHSGSAYRARLLDPLGQPLGPTRSVTVAGTLSPRKVGGFVWTRKQGTNLKVQLLNTQGAPQGRSVALRGAGSSDIRVLPHESGEFLVIWSSLGSAIRARRFRSDGRPAAATLTLAPEPPLGASYYPLVAAIGPNGSVALAWHLYTGHLPHAYDISIHTYAFEGRQIGAYTMKPPPGASEIRALGGLAVGPDGGVLVTWVQGEVLSPKLPRARLLSARAQPEGAALQVSSSSSAEYPDARCLVPVAVGDSWVVAWVGRHENLSARLLVRRFEQG